MQKKTKNTLEMNTIFKNAFDLKAGIINKSTIFSAMQLTKTTLILFSKEYMFVRCYRTGGVAMPLTQFKNS